MTIAPPPPSKKSNDAKSHRESDRDRGHSHRSSGDDRASRGGASHSDRDAEKRGHSSATGVDPHASTSTARTAAAECGPTQGIKRRHSSRGHLHPGSFSYDRRSDRKSSNALNPYAASSSTSGSSSSASISSGPSSIASNASIGTVSSAGSVTLGVGSLLLDHDPDLEPPSDKRRITFKDIPGSPNHEEDAAGRESPSGYNSEDEYRDAPAALMPSSASELAEKEVLFEEMIRQKGWFIKKMGEDGACLFRAVADQVYGDQEMHSVVRKLCMDYMAKNSDYFSQYVTEDFDKYLTRKRGEGIHGNHVEMQAMSEMFNRPIEVYQYTLTPISTFSTPYHDTAAHDADRGASHHGHSGHHHGHHAHHHGHHGHSQPHNAHRHPNEEYPIRLSYHRAVHYNSIVDPYKASIGVGLGLPGFKPGHAEKSVIDVAVRQSVADSEAIEKAMLEDKLRATDWEATAEAIEEQVARESYLDWVRDNERRHKPTTSAMPSSSNKGQRSPPTAAASSSRALSPKYGAHSSASSVSSPLRGFKSSSTSTSASGRNGGSSPKAGSSKRVPTPPSASPKSTATSAHLAHESNFYDEFNMSASFLDNDLDPQDLGLNDWDETKLLARVLAQSRQEYLDTLKRNRSPPRETSSSAANEAISKSARDNEPTEP